MNREKSGRQSISGFFIYFWLLIFQIGIYNTNIIPVGKISSKLINQFSIPVRLL